MRSPLHLAFGEQKHSFADGVSQLRSISAAMATGLLCAWIFAATSVAQAESPTASPPGTSAPASTEATFARLRDYIVAHPLDFKTSFVAHSDTLGTMRGSLHFLVQRPNLFRIESSYGRGSYVVTSDGKVMTIYRPEEEKYAHLPAPSSPRQGLGLVTGLMSMESQALVLLGVVEDIAAGSKEYQVTPGSTETIGGLSCDSFSIVEATDVVTTKWKVWLQKADVPLVCKFVTGSTESLADATQTNEFSWKLDPVFPPDTFVFTPPKGSQMVDVGSLGLEPYY